MKIDKYEELACNQLVYSKGMGQEKTYASYSQLQPLSQHFSFANINTKSYRLAL